MSKTVQNKSKKIDNKKLSAYVEKAQQGDREATENIIKETSDYIYYYCFMMLKKPQDAMDAVQDILIVVIEKINKVKEPKAFLGWLKTITANYCSNKVTRNNKVILSESYGEENPFDDLKDFNQQQIPEAKLDNDETRRMIQELIKALPDAQRECILMYYYQEMSVSEIADAVGVSQGTVKSRLNYGRKTIKEGVLGYEKQGVKLYGLGVLPFLTYFLTTGVSSLKSEINPELILFPEKNVEGLAKLAIDTRLIEGATTIISSPHFSDTINSLTSKIAIGAMMVAVLVSTGVAGRIFADEEKNGPYNKEYKKPVAISAMATTDESAKYNKEKNAYSNYIGNNSQAVKVSTPDTAVKENTERLFEKPTETQVIDETQALTENNQVVKTQEITE